MAVYIDLKVCCLVGKGWSLIKAFDVQKDGWQANANLCEHSEGSGEEVSKRVAQETANIGNTHFMSKHTYSSEKFSTVLQDAFTILNNK